MSPRATLPRGLAAGFLLAATAACFDSAPPTPVATTISLSKATVSLNAIGATDQLSAAVKDQNGATMTGATVTWSSSASNVASVSGTGLVTAVANGIAQVTATSGSATGSAAVTVAQVPAAVQKVGGDAQTGAVGTALGQSLTVQVNDGEGHAIQGVTVTFAPSSGGGSVSPASGTTGADGRLSTAWTLPTTVGSYSVTATPSAGAGSAQFTATAVAGAASILAAVSGNSQTGQVGAPLANPVVVKVTDQHGNAVQNHTVTFTPAAGSGSVLPTSAPTDASGQALTVWTLGPASGTHTMQASATGLTGSPATFTATATGAAPATVEVHAGDGQTGLVGYRVNRRPAVIVKDASGTAFPGASVTFAVASGGGSATGLTATTGADGIATVGSWTLGASAGSNTLTATVTGSGITGNPVTFTATGAAAAYDIEVRYVFTPSAGQQAALNAAVARWETIIFGDMIGANVQQPAQTCGGIALPAISETVDDVVIYAQLDSIDGPAGVLGQAQPCYLRTVGALTAVGVMKFDTTDLNALETAGLLDEVITHEMGHVLGYGTLWTLVNPPIIADRSDPNTGGTAGADAHFTGAQALWAFDQVGGTSYAAGAKVPVENDNANYGTGSLDVHWRESVFGTELMTPALNGGQANPISMVSAASMGDLGYTVNYAGAESYTLPGSAPPVGEPSVIFMHNDVLMGEMHVLGPDGRIVRTIRRR